MNDLNDEIKNDTDTEEKDLSSDITDQQEPEGPAIEVSDGTAEETQDHTDEQTETIQDEISDPVTGAEGSQTDTETTQSTYNQDIPHYNDRYEKTESKKSNSGAIIAILAAVTALAIIFACCALVIGLMNRNGRLIGRNDTTTEIESKTPDDTKKPFIPKDSDTPQNTDQVQDTEKSGPSAATDPTAVINLGDSEKKYAMTEVAAMTVNSVVEIRTEQVVTGNFMQQYVSKGAGSGVIVTKDGYIATNNHVIDGATSITVVLRNGKSYEAALIGADSVADLAVVKIDANDLEPAVFGSSDKLVVAESVIAIGNPLGSLGGSVTDGIISALARNVTVEGQEMTLMQTTAAINPGNSGGGLFNMSGECIGIVNAKSSGEDIEGIGFAIPSDTAVPIIEDLIKYGYVRGRVMLGVSMVEVNDAYTARRYGLSEIGVYISSVYANSDAEKAGMKEKDRIVSINGHEISEYAEVKRLILKFHVGDEAEIVVKRNGELITLKVVFSEYVPS